MQARYPAGCHKQRQGIWDQCQRGPRSRTRTAPEQLHSIPLARQRTKHRWSAMHASTASAGRWGACSGGPPPSGAREGPRRPGATMSWTRTTTASTMATTQRSRTSAEQATHHSMALYPREPEYSCGSDSCGETASVARNVLPSTAVGAKLG